VVGLALAVPLARLSNYHPRLFCLKVRDTLKRLEYAY
jgi:hypothetical protein